MSDTDLSPDEREALVVEMREFQARYQATGATMAELEDLRGEFYMRARALPKPITYAELADIFGVTPAAIQHKERRILKRQATPQP